MAPSIDDAWILRYANDEGAVLLTADKDFGELVYRQKRATAGVLLIRLGGLPSQAKAALVAAAMEDHYQELQGRFAVVTPGSLRIRGGPSDGRA